ncbi:MAG: T9SS type A sorting domain-containing protein [Bacteroidia bacterium]|nr:T9SS type A sorting domain-containing protein [Bacteroidia bacterium]
MQNKQYVSIRLKRTQWLLVGAGALAILFGILATLATNISGVVNTYTRVTAVGTNTVTVQSTSGFSAGDKVLIVQMKGATISTTNDSTYGNITSYGNAGNYEFATIASRSGRTFTLTRNLCRSYTVADKVQLIRVPVYNGDVNVTGTLTALKWDGNVGGVLAIEVKGKLTLSANINVAGMGFRGGEFNGAATAGGLDYICDVSSGKGGIKGEGVTELPQAGCRGKLATGGGGGNDHNGGGGGGGNYGRGGIGGHGWLSNTPGSLSDLYKGGRGGLPLATLYNAGTPKIFLGGGGGGGHQNNGASIPAGDGAGVAIIIASTLEVSGNRTVMAGAEDATDVEVNDGAGGGGAGGAILLDVQTFVNPNNLTLDVSGGDGASVITADQHGPGGGGGGGYINSTQPLPAGITVNVSGGAPGIFVTSNTSNPYRNTSHGAVQGEPGAVVNTLILQTCSAPPVLDLDNTVPATNYSISYTTGEPAYALTDMNRVNITDNDDTEMTYAEIVLTNPLDGAYEGLRATAAPSVFAGLGLAVSFSVDSLTAYLTGEAPIAAYRQALSYIGYRNYDPDANLTNRTVTVKVDDGGAYSNTTQVTIWMLAGNFPVEWLSFGVELDGTSARLAWATASELNSDYFVVERSTDGVVYEALGKVGAAGTTQVRSDYRYTDPEATQAGQGILYYRLRQVDLDGMFSYSTIAELRLSQSEVYPALRIYPHPAREAAKIRVPVSHTGRWTLRILNMAGQEVHQEPLERAGEFDLPVASLTPGSYVIQLNDGQTTLNEKLIIY